MIEPAGQLGSSQRDAVALGSRVALPWGVLMAAVLTLALGAALYQGLNDVHTAAAPATRPLGPSREALLSLPLAAQAPASAALGTDSPAYRVTNAPGGYRAANPAQHLRSSFASSGVSVSSGATRVGLSLSGVGYGTEITTLGAVAPRARRNRVLYRHQGLSEWYVNGPLGLEQGFTVVGAPAGHAPGPLTLSITLSGNAHPSLSKGAHGITLVGAGKDVLRYSGLSATDARGRLLRSWMQLEHGRVLLRVDAAGASYPLRIDPFLHQGIKLTPSGQTTHGDFGVRAALSADGNTALITGYGAAWVFTRSGASWTQQGEKLTPSGGAAFGSSLALSADGNTALIGSSSEESLRGAAWVFTRTGETWTQQGEKLTGAEANGQAEFGTSVALSADGNTALIGARRDHLRVGAAYVFTRSGETWSQQGERLTGGGESGEGRFGEGVALSGDGNTAIVGAGYENKLGAVYVFTRSGEAWTQQGEKLTGSGEYISGTQYDLIGFFGSSVALSEDGDTAVIGAKGAGGNGGGAWLFTRSGETWTQQGAFGGLGETSTEKTPAYFGASVALSGDGSTVLIGAPGEANIGFAYVLTRSGETWAQQGGKLGSGEKATSGFGSGVALSGDGSSALVGNPGNGLTGAAWVFGQKAPAEPPEFGRCTKTLRTSEGDFGTSSCTTLKTPGNYEWLPGAGKNVKFTNAITEGLATLETVKGSKVVCTSEAGTGEYTGNRTVGGVALKFTGCERVGEQCTSAAAASGEIVTDALEDRPRPLPRRARGAGDELQLRCHRSLGARLGHPSRRGQQNAARDQTKIRGEQRQAETRKIPRRRKGRSRSLLQQRSLRTDRAHREVAANQRGTDGGQRSLLELSRQARPRCPGARLALPARRPLRSSGILGG
jgi:hypothetical protein